jgi:tRNA-specific 2-thiouridylase
MNRKAIIAMSGGVDSSVAAALTLDSGRECIGVTLKLYSDDDIEKESRRRFRGCCSLSDINDARGVAFRLGMPHYVLNFTEEFRKQVIGRFIETYRNGATPNPCIDCNRYIKFEKLLERAARLDFDCIVTGHYARIEKDNATGRFLLRKSVDQKKDQSYVLYTLTQKQLEHTLLPLGTLTKPEVRKIAEEKRFINAHKSDSQDICFVPGGDYGKFIEHYTGKGGEEGNIVDETGRILGKHRGIIRYTLGQRRGLGIAGNEPLYVSAKSPEHNTVTVGKENSLYSKTLNACDINLIACDKIEKALRVQVKTRYQQKEQWASAEQTGENTLRLDFDEPQRALTPGQAAVLYDGEYVVGGGTIM